MLQGPQIQNLETSNGMLVRCSINVDENISHSVTLVPRLEYSVNLLDEIITTLREKRDDIKELNRSLASDFDEEDKTHLAALNLEHTISFSFEVLSNTKKRMARISGISSIPEVLPSAIPMIRIISAQLFDVVPHCSQKLSELSVHLGSIVLDSAALTKARFDFSQSNEESSAILDEVKLMVDSKISKQYPNLDFFKLCTT